MARMAVPRCGGKPGGRRWLPPAAAGLVSPARPCTWPRHGRKANSSAESEPRVERPFAVTHRLVLDRRADDPGLPDHAAARFGRHRGHRPIWRCRSARRAGRRHDRLRRGVRELQLPALGHDGPRCTGLRTRRRTGRARSVLARGRDRRHCRPGAGRARARHCGAWRLADGGRAARHGAMDTYVASACSPPRSR